MLTQGVNLYVILSLIRKLQCYQIARSLKLIGAFRSFLHNERTINNRLGKGYPFILIVSSQAIHDKHVWSR